MLIYFALWTSNLILTRVPNFPYQLLINFLDIVGSLAEWKINYAAFLF